MLSLIIKPHAILLVKEVFDWYEKQKVGLGEEFLAELDVCYKKIQFHPEYFSKIKGNTRQVALKRFPYALIYEVIESEVVIFSVIHTKQNSKSRYRN